MQGLSPETTQGRIRTNTVIPSAHIQKNSSPLMKNLTVEEEIQRGTKETMLPLSQAVGQSEDQLTITCIIWVR